MTRLVLLALAAQSAACTGGDARQAADPGEPLSVRWSREFNTDASYADIQEVLVWRGSVTRQDHGTVDVYDIGAGRWITSLAVDAAAVGIDVAPGVLVVLTSDDNGAGVIAYAR
jgi:hypothetical protein